MSATLPLAARFWSPSELTAVRRRRHQGASLDELAASYATSRQEIDVVLWELFDTDPVAASRQLDARRALQPAMPTTTRGLAARIRRMFG